MTTSTSDLPTLVPTFYTREITAALDAANRRRLFGFISGETGRSKTLTCKHYAASHPEVAFVDLPDLPGAVSSAELVRLFAVALLGSDYGSQRANRLEIHNYLIRHRRLIIVDEANQLLHAASSRTIVKNLEFIRRNIFDLTNTAVVLVFTGYTLSDLRHGTLSGFLEQFRGRIGFPLQIKALRKNTEVKPIVLHYVPNADQALIDAADSIARPGDGKLRTLVKYLELAAEYSERKGVPITAEMLLQFRGRFEDGGAWEEDR
ncbi:AAA family ATPase [Victivallis vadensis]|uniref:AAA family ATPase n=1 Tax=Victivallis vadensis TaxID=172901 RepID=UPI003CFCABEC